MADERVYGVIGYRSVSTVHQGGWIVRVMALFELPCRATLASRQMRQAGRTLAARRRSIHVMVMASSGHALIRSNFEASSAALDGPA